MAVIACAGCGASLHEWSPPGTRCGRCRAEQARARLEREAELRRPRLCEECSGLYLPTKLEQRFVAARAG